MRRFGRVKKTWTVCIDRRLGIRLPPMSPEWRLGQRVYLSLLPGPKLLVSVFPAGLWGNRLLSVRVRRVSPERTRRR